MSDTFFLVVGIIFSLIGILSFLGGILSKKKCTETIEGTISKLIDKTNYHRGITIHYITPVVQYFFKGQLYEAKMDISTNDTKKYHVGDPIRFLVNPDRPEEIRPERTAAPYVFGLITLAIGAVLVWCYFM